MRMATQQVFIRDCRFYSGPYIFFSGIFVDNARKLIPSPEWSTNTMKRYFETTMKDAVAHGLTSIHDAGTSPKQILFFQKYCFTYRATTFR